MPSAPSDTSERVTPISLIRGASILAPADIGQRDLVWADGRILAILEPGERFSLGSRPLEEIDGSGRVLVPALVDLHCHPTGGGGWGGPETRCDPIEPAAFIEAGIGTIAGLLGYDTSARRPEGLLGRTRTLSAMGFAAHMYAGEIAWPAATITGELGRDIALIPEVRGIKAAIADHDGGITTVDRLTFVVSEAMRGSRTAGKPAVVHLHVGRASQGFEVINEALDRDLINPSVLTLTHINWSRELAEQAAPLAKAGINLDLTSCIRPDFFPGTITPAEALEILIAGGAPLERITVSSDAGGSHLDPASGKIIGHRPKLMLEAFREALNLCKPEDALTMFTSNPADRLGLRRNGRIAVGARADLVLFDQSFEEGTLYLAGQARPEKVG